MNGFLVALFSVPLTVTGVGSLVLLAYGRVLFGTLMLLADALLIALLVVMYKKS